VNLGSNSGEDRVWAPHLSKKPVIAEEPEEYEQRIKIVCIKNPNPNSTPNKGKILRKNEIAKTVYVS